MEQGRSWPPGQGSGGPGAILDRRGMRKYPRGLIFSSIAQNFNKITHLKDSGYIRLTSKDAVLMFDVAPVGPDYIPGHAHADTLVVKPGIGLD